MSGPSVVVRCPECEQQITVPIDVVIEGDAMRCDPDLSDVWAHAWTHEGDRHASSP